MLRSAIWKHLVEMSKPDQKNGKSTTIVITTHYIEEARQANKVGMMRFGKLLAEGAPEELLERYEKPNLEDVFLALCMQDGDLETTKTREERKSRPSIVKHDKAEADNLIQSKTNGQVVMVNGKHNNNQDKAKDDWMPSNKNSKGQKVKACMLKTFNRMKRRIGFLIYQFVLPALQVSLFCLAIGQDPKDLPVAVVNAENAGASCHYFNASSDRQCPLNFDGTFGLPEPNEHLSNFTCRYLSFVDASIAHPVYFTNLTDAVQSVEDGHTWGIVSMDENFSQNLFDRILDSATNSDLKSVNLELLEKSSIKIRMDVTNQHIAFTLQMKFMEAFEAFTKQIFQVCDLPTEHASIPLVFEEPIYGSHELTFTDFMAPGIILTIVHSMALGYSAMIIIMERNEGLLDRTWVAGVTPGEFALSHFLVSLVVNLLQVIVTLVFMILIFQVPAEGSIVWIFLLTMLQGICGTTIGLIISAVCRTQQDATQIALGIFYPNLILSGIIWPVESMPTILR